MSEAPELEKLEISVRPSPETNDHEVLLRTDQGDLIERFASEMIGLDPDDILVEPCPLLTDDEPKTATIGRCDCGVIGCGSVEVSITRVGKTITWTTKNRPTGVAFDAVQYQQEVRRALADFSWETPDRTAARAISTSVDRAVLAKSGLDFTWASGRIAPNTMTVCLALDEGQYQLLVSIPWSGETPADIADRSCQLLLTAPQSWEQVRWFPQRQGLGVPRLAGSGWREGTT